jgi:hypothetical protein
MARRIQIKTVRKRTINTNDLAYAYFLMGKQLVRERREREAREKSKSREQSKHGERAQ